MNVVNKHRLRYGATAPPRRRFVEYGHIRTGAAHAHRLHQQRHERWQSPKKKLIEEEAQRARCYTARDEREMSLPIERVRRRDEMPVRARYASKNN